MSYRLKVLKDYPIGFWPLDELYTSLYSVSTYNDSTTLYNEPSYYNSSSVYTSAAADYSGCGNNGTYNGEFLLNDYLLPLVSGGGYGTNITSTGSIQLPLLYDYNGIAITGGLATKYTSDNDFSLEVWIYPKFTTTSSSPIFADATNSIGIYWENGNIVFKVGAQRVDYTLPFTDKAIHIVATYSSRGIAIYINGEIKSYLSLSNFLFTNTSVLFAIGPTSDIADSFIVDAPAIYRYALSETKILDHYDSFKTIPAIQIVSPDKGTLFSLSDKYIKKDYTYSYPYNRLWSSFNDAALYYNSIEDYIALYETQTSVSSQVILNDLFTIPNGPSFISSKVEWDASTGIDIQTSVDGVTYVSCINGEPIPQYKLGSNTFNTNYTIYVRIILNSSDTSKFLPRLSSLIFTFYLNKIIYADNSGDYILPETPSPVVSGTTVWDYQLGSTISSILSRSLKDGLRPYNSGFSINTKMSVNSIELFLNPIALTSSYLFYHDSASYSWNSSGVITKTGIASIYVNGINRTSSTNISAYLNVNTPHHIVITLSAPITTKIYFNTKSTGGVWSNSGPRNLYKNIAIYPSVLSETKILEHRDLYINNQPTQTENPYIVITENSVKSYNFDWTVLKSV